MHQPLVKHHHRLPPIVTAEPLWVFRLTALNVAAIALHIVSASLGQALIRESNPKIPCIAPLFEYVTSGSRNSEIFHTEPKVIFRIGALTSLVVFEWITAGFHVLYVVQLHSARFREFVARFLDMRTHSINPLRWVEYSITAGILSAFGNLNLGITDFYIFLTMLSSNIAIQAIGYVLEILDGRDNFQKRLSRILWWQATLINVTHVAFLLYQLFSSKTHTTVFYYNVLPYTILYQTFGIVAKLNFNRTGPFAHASYTEFFYILLSLSTKLAVFWLGFSTFRGIEETRGFAAHTKGVDWDAVRNVASYGPLGILVLISIMEWYKMYNSTHGTKFTESVPKLALNI